MREEIVSLDEEVGTTSRQNQLASNEPVQLWLDIMGKHYLLMSEHLHPAPTSSPKSCVSESNTFLIEVVPFSLYHHLRLKFVSKEHSKLKEILHICWGQSSPLLLFGPLASILR